MARFRRRASASTPSFCPAICWRAAASACAAASWPPSTSPRNWRWPARSRPATTAPIFRASRWLGWRRSPRSSWRAAAGGKSVDFRWLDDFVGVEHRRSSAGRNASKAEAVFVGHGISAPEYKWDDYKGVDVKGKILVLFTNEPPPPIRSSSTAAPSLTTAAGPTSTKRRCGAGARALHHHPHHPDRRLRLGRGAQLLGTRDALREAGTGRARRWLSPDGSPARRAKSCWHWRARPWTNCWRPRTAPISSRSPGDSDPRLNCPPRSARSETRNVLGIDSGQRPATEGPGRDLQRALGSPGDRYARERRRRFTTARWTTPPAARCCWSWRARGRRSPHEAAGAPRCSWP